MLAVGQYWLQQAELAEQLTPTAPHDPEVVPLEEVVPLLVPLAVPLPVPVPWLEPLLVLEVLEVVAPAALMEVQDPPTHMPVQQSAWTVQVTSSVNEMSGDEGVQLQAPPVIVGITTLHPVGHPKSAPQAPLLLEVEAGVQATARRKPREQAARTFDVIQDPRAKRGLVCPRRDSKCRAVSMVPCVFLRALRRPLRSLKRASRQNVLKISPVISGRCMSP